MAKRFGADQWRAWFVEFEQTDLTVARFCESIGVSVQSYYKWRRKLKSLDGSAAQTDSNTGFVPVVLQTSFANHHSAGLLEIELPCGAIARVPNDTGSLRPILSLLLNRELAQ